MTSSLNEEPATQRLPSLTSKDLAAFRNIILVGPSGSGKSSIGRALSVDLGLGFIDTDEMVAQAFKAPIAQIFATRSESEFRQEEEKQIARLINLKGFVIACGGGSLESASSRSIMSSLGLKIWLNPGNDEITRRLLADASLLAARPLIADVLEIKEPRERQTKLKQRVQALSEQRASHYRASDIDFSSRFTTVEIAAKALSRQIASFVHLSQSHQANDIALSQFH